MPGDASLVAIAARLGTTDIATLDERHFRTLRPLTGEPAFRLLPADAD
jgi:predicted nucleic acid-binding protein